jgi:phospholipase/lecithinase/hemolysin
MKSMKWKVALLAAAAVLAGCGGGSTGGNQQLRVSYSSLVSFGDSLSDVGTYQVGGVVAMGGGKYTINSSTDKNWTELIAAQMGLAAPCPAQKGLDGNAAYGFSVPVVNTAACLNYAQGGARVTNPVGPGNKLLGGGNATIGQLTVPILTQIQNHLAKVSNKFSGTELVTVMAGANDVFIQLGTVGATVSAAQQLAQPQPPIQPTQSKPQRRPLMQQQLQAHLKLRSLPWVPLAPNWPGTSKH